MSKRLSDTEVWKKSWFFDLPDRYKLFWFYILSDCDAAGIWTVNQKITKAYLGEIDFDKIIELFKNQIVVLNGGNYWLIIDFIKFQYGYPVKETATMYKKLDTLLKERKLNIDTLYSTVSVGYQYSIDTDKDKDKDKEEVKDKAEDKDKKGENETFELWYSEYPRKEAKQDAIKAWNKLQKSMPELSVMVDKLKKQIIVHNWTRENMKFIPLPASYLNGKRWEDVVEDIKPVFKGMTPHDFAFM